MRLFTSIDLDHEVVQRLVAFVARLEGPGSPRFVDPRRFHLTTKFLGGVKEQELTRVVEALQRVPPCGDVEVIVAGVGFFPDARHPRVFFASVEQTPSLMSLAAQTELCLAKSAAISPDTRPFSPHLTLARLKTPAEAHALRRVLATKAVEHDLFFGRFVVAAFSLWASSARPDGSHYERLATFSLRPPAR